MIDKIKAKTKNVHRVLDKGEHWTHAAYCGILFFEGHGTYASVGGLLGVFVVLNMFVGGQSD